MKILVSGKVYRILGREFIEYRFVEGNKVIIKAIEITKRPELKDIITKEEKLIKAPKLELEIPAFMRKPLKGGC